MTKTETPLTVYLSKEVVERLDNWFSIKNMEKLVSLFLRDPEFTKGLAKELKINKEEFEATIQKASKELNVSL